jgi:hypothetical protein
VQFEGLSRRLEKPIELPSSAEAASSVTAPSVQAAPSVPVNGGKPFSVAAANPGSFTPVGNPGPFSPVGA